MSNQTVAHFVQNIISNRELNAKEKEILIERLQDKTLGAIGKEFHVTGERIRQIEEKALQKFLSKISQLILFD